MIMLVRDKEYLVIREIYSDTHCTQYIVKEVTSNIFYKIAVLEKQYIVPELILFLSEQIKNQPFTDFVDYHTEYEKIYIFMKYVEHKSLEEKLKTETCVFDERMDIAIKILEKIIVLDIPPYFSANSCTLEYILVSPSGDVYFNYHMKDLDSVHTITEWDSMLAFSKVLRMLFAKELKDGIIFDMEQLIYDIEYGFVSKTTDVFAIFHKITINPIQLEHSFKEKMVIFFKRLWVFLGHLMKVFMIILAIYYLLLSIKDYRQHDYNDNFEQIGVFYIEEII